MFDFLKSYKIVQNRSDIPTRKAIYTTALTDICESFEDGFKRFLMCELQSIGTAFDLWTDGHDNYLNLSVQTIDKHWNLHFVNLGTDPIARPHKAVRIERHIEEKLAMFGLDQMINISVKDNGGNVIKACSKIHFSGNRITSNTI